MEAILQHRIVEWFPKTKVLFGLPNFPVPFFRHLESYTFKRKRNKDRLIGSCISDLQANRKPNPYP